MALNNTISSDLGLSTGARMMVIGDSITRFNVDGSVTGVIGYNCRASQRGPLNWMQFLLGNPFRIDYAYRGEADSSELYGDNRGIGGEETSGILRRLDRSIIRQAPDLVYVGVGTNDVKNGRDTEQIKNNLKSIVEIIISAGAHVWLSTILPRRHNVLSSWSPELEAVRNQVNSYIRSFEPLYKGSVTIVDYDHALSDIDGYVKSQYVVDGLHPSAEGAYVMARDVLVPLWRKAIGHNAVRRIIPGAYDATMAPFGNIFSNANFTATGGTLGTGVTGSLPGSTRALRTGGSNVTAVASVVSDLNWNGSSVNWAKILCSVTGSGADTEVISFNQYISASDTFTLGIEAGEWYEASVEVFIEPTVSGQNPLRSISCILTDLTDDDSSSTAFSLRATDGSLDYMPDDPAGIRLILKTPPLQSKGVDGFTFKMRQELNGALTGARAVKFAQPVVRKLSTKPQDLARVHIVRAHRVSNDIYMILPKRCIIEELIVINNTANAVTGGIKIGTTSGGTEVISALSVGANAQICTRTFNTIPFSMTANQNLYVQDVTAWNSANLDIYLVCKEM